MPKRKQFRKFGAQYLIRNVFVVSAFGLLGLGLWFLEAPSWTLFAVFALTIVTLIAIDAFAFRNFSCPECGDTLPRVDIRGGEDQIWCFFCKECDIEWDTGLRTPDS